LPVHGLLHDKRGTVYAYIGALEALRQSRMVNDTAHLQPVGMQALEEAIPADQREEGARAAFIAEPPFTDISAEMQ